MNNENLIGKVFKTKYSECEIILYEDYRNVQVKFPTGYTCKVSFGNLKRGAVKDPLSKTVLGVACIGIGKHSRSTSKLIYQIWFDMLKRCYSDRVKAIRNTYKDCRVCDEWLNFQNFAEWCEKQNNFENFELDKDLLVRGNKFYSPETCCFIPQDINGTLVKNERKRLNKDTPIGVTKVVQVNGVKYLVYFSKKKKLTYCGSYGSVEEAFSAYKVAKEGYLKELAEKWKDKIDDRTYEALINYEVDIDD